MTPSELAVICRRSWLPVAGRRPRCRRVMAGEYLPATQRQRRFLRRSSAIKADRLPSFLIAYNSPGKTTLSAEPLNDSESISASPIFIPVLHEERRSSVGPRSIDLTQDEVVLLNHIQNGDLHFIDRHKAERLFQVGLASIASDQHVLLTEEGREYLRTVTRIGE